MADDKTNITTQSPGNPADPSPPQLAGPAPADDTEEEETDSEDDLEDVNVETGNDGVQKNIAKLLKILVKDRRRDKTYRTEVRKPTDFRGTESARDARNWIHSFERYFKGRKVKSDAEKINTALSYLVGKAAEFARRLQRELDAHDDWEDGGEEGKEPSCCKTWDDFKLRFLHEFVDADPTLTAREELRKLRMESDQKAEEFLTEFKNLASETGYDEAALIDMLQIALIPRITAEVLRLRIRPKDVEKTVPGYRPETLDEWYEMAGDLDRSYRLTRQRMNEIKGQNGTRSKTNTPSTPSHTSAPPKNNQNQGFRNNFRHNSGGGQGSGDNRRFQYQARAMKDMSEVICYRCDKKGHISRDCPTRASGSGQQQDKQQPVNIRTAGIPDETLELIARVLQNVNAQQSGASADSGKGKQPHKGFWKGRK